MTDKEQAKSFLITFILMFLFWIILSNIFDWVHISLGIISSLIVAYLSHEIFITTYDVTKLPKKAFRFTSYVLWLIKEIVKANIDVAKILLHPDLPISPRIIRYESDLDKELSQTTFGNSITLTPGTLTIDIDEENNFYVHCLAKKHAEGLEESEMEKRIKNSLEESEKND